MNNDKKENLIDFGLVFVGFFFSIPLSILIVSIIFAIFNPDYKAMYQSEYEVQLNHLKQVECQYYRPGSYTTGGRAARTIYMLQCVDAELEEKYGIKIDKDTSLTDSLEKTFNETVKSIEEIEK